MNIEAKAWKEVVSFFKWLDSESETIKLKRDALAILLEEFYNMGWKAGMEQHKENMIVKVAINIPSGKLICGNDFRDLYVKNSRDISFDVNEIVGIKKTIEAYGERGLFHGFCGNSCPGLYLNGNQLNIVAPAYDDNNDEIDPNLGEKVGGICTDLWWYCVADYDDFINRGGKVDPQWDTIIDVEPGRYILSHDLDSRNPDCCSLEHYATIERSDEEIVPWKMLEEGTVEAIMELLPDKYKSSKTVTVPRPKECSEEYWDETIHGKHTYSTRLHIRTTYEEYDIDNPLAIRMKTGYEIWGPVFDGNSTQYINVKAATAEQLQDYKSMTNAVIADFQKKEKRKRVMVIHMEDHEPE
jgi:hypothetical protein